MENKGGKRLAPTGEPVKTTPPAPAAGEVKTPAEQPALSLIHISEPTRPY